MRVTRRSLIQMLGLGAAAAALAPATVVKAEVVTAVISQSVPEGAVVDMTGAQSVSVIGAEWHDVKPVPALTFVNDPELRMYRTGESHLTFSTDAIDQARADGYGDGYVQGRLVEEARQESRHKSTWSKAIAGRRFECATCRWETQPVEAPRSLADIAGDIFLHMVTAHNGVQQPTYGVRDA